MSLTVTTKFKTGDIAYYVNYASASLYQCTVMRVFVGSPGGTVKALYRIRVNSNGKELFNVTEDDLFTFLEAKGVLRDYLTDKIAELDTLIG